MISNEGFFGRYRFLNFVTLPTGIVKILQQTEWIDNIIVNSGKSVLLNRFKDNTIAAIAGMAIGTGTTPPEMATTALGTETVRKACTGTVVTSPTYYVKFNATFTGAEINGTTEIALFNSATGSAPTLVAMNLHDAISIPAGSSMSVDYMIGIITGMVLEGFTLDSGHVYVLGDIDVPVNLVYDSDGNGFHKKTSIVDCEAQAGSYYYASGTSELYIHCPGGVDPDTLTITAMV